MENLWRRRFHSRKKTLNRRLKARLRRKLKSRATGSGKRNGFRVLALIDVHWLITYKRRVMVMATITLLSVIDLRTTLLTRTLYNAWHTACSNCFQGLTLESWFNYLEQNSPQQMSSTTGTIQTQLLSSFTEHLNIKILTIFLKLFHSGLQSNELYFWASNRFAGYKEHFSGFFCLVFVFRICLIRSIRCSDKAVRNVTSQNTRKGNFFSFLGNSENTTQLAKCACVF